MIIVERYEAGYLDIPLSKYQEVEDIDVISDKLETHDDILNKGRRKRTPSLLEEMGISSKDVEDVNQFIFKLIRSKYTGRELELTLLEEEMYSIIELFRMEKTIMQMQSFLTNSLYENKPARIPIKNPTKITLYKLKKTSNEYIVKGKNDQSLGKFKASYHEYNNYDENIELNISSLQKDYKVNPSIASNITKFNNYLFNSLSRNKFDLGLRFKLEANGGPKIDPSREEDLTKTMNRSTLNREHIFNFVRDKYFNINRLTEKDTYKSLRNKDMKEELLNKILSARINKERLGNTVDEPRDSYSIGLNNIYSENIDDFLDLEDSTTIIDNIEYEDDRL